MGCIHEDTAASGSGKQSADTGSPSPLTPVVTQDDRTGEVLMLAYMSPESRRLTEETGYATYYSRSRKTLWTKGATSGNRQRVRRLTEDCDQDALLLQVYQEGTGSCHTGARTCFATQDRARRTGPVLVRLERTVRERLEHPREGSYTTRLQRGGLPRIAQKVVEEAGEVAIAGAIGDRPGVAREAADLLYHLWVLLAASGVTYAEVAEELASREREEGGSGSSAEGASPDPLFCPTSDPVRQGVKR